MPKTDLLVTGLMMPIIADQIDKAFACHNLLDHPDREALYKAKGNAIEAICTGSHTGVKCDAAMIERLPKLKVIANFGVGYDSVDVAAATKRGIIVTNTPDVLTEEVADTAIGLMIMTVREFDKAERWLRDGNWQKHGDYRLSAGSLRDRTLGMVGMGRIGQAIAKRAAAFGMPIAYFSRSKKPGVAYPYYDNLVEMAKNVDILMAITPGGPATQNMINADVLKALGPRGILINMARGSVVDEAALIAALKAKTILSAGLDVFVGEPKVNPELLTLDNLTVLPHLGSASAYTRNKMGQMVVDNLAAYLARKPPVSPVPETPFQGW
jgi:lactate dehydrogenase-like 2-hydroxyacid dehydrogenase